MSAVVLPSWLLFSGNLGVPVKPKYCALLKYIFIALCISPNWLLWHSSIINTTFSSLYFSINFAYLGLLIALAIFWIVVIINGFVESCIFFTNLYVLFVKSTEPGSNLLNSSKVCVSKSFLSTKKNTCFMLGSFANIWLALNEVRVFPEPVVCHIYPLLLVSNARFTNASTAYTWYGLITINCLSVSFIIIYLAIILDTKHFSKKYIENSLKLLILLFSSSVQKNVYPKFISPSVFAKYFVFTPLLTTYICINLYNSLYDVLLYLSIWFTASFNVFPLAFNSICINGNPLINSVTSYLVSLSPVILVIWFETWYIFLHHCLVLKSSIYILSPSSRSMHCFSLKILLLANTPFPVIIVYNLSNSLSDSSFPFNSDLLCILTCFLKFSFTSSKLFNFIFVYPNNSKCFINFSSNIASLSYSLDISYPPQIYFLIMVNFHSHFITKQENILQFSLFFYSIF